MTREAAILRIEKYFDSDDFYNDLARRIAIKTDSRDLECKPDLYTYLNDEITPLLDEMGFSCETFTNLVDYGGPFLIAERFEGEGLPKVLIYGHGDVVLGYETQWNEGLAPWKMVSRDGRWYERGTADNKGQHTINLAALKCVLDTRGKLGFNFKVLLETSVELGSPGLSEFVFTHKNRLMADVLIASNGPRLSPERPTLFMGSRGLFNFKMSFNLRDGSHHSGDWGGLLANPSIILSHAISSMITKDGKVLVDGIRPPGPIPNSVRNAISNVQVDGGEGGAGDRP